MRPITLSILLGSLGAAQAILRIPLESQFKGSNSAASLQRRSPDIPAPQMPLHDASTADENGVFSEPDIVWILVGFNMSIGEPPQHVPVALSIESYFTMVQSASCHDDACEDHVGFNSSKSSTFNSSWEIFDEGFGLCDWIGFVASDTISFAGAELPDARLLLAEEIHKGPFFMWYHLYDGVLGLSPHSDTWKALSASGVLEEKIFSLEFPSGKVDLGNLYSHRTPGELTLGGVNPDYAEGPFIDFPSTNISDDLWATSISSLTSNFLGDDFNYLSKPSTAVFLSANPFITLPNKLVHQLYDQIRNDTIDMFPGVPIFLCEIRESMANVSMTLGSGDMQHNITLSPYEYSVEVENLEGKTDACAFLVSGSDSAVGLGWPLLQNFVTVFDYENSRIRCKMLP